LHLVAERLAGHIELGSQLEPWTVLRPRPNQILEVLSTSLDGPFQTSVEEIEDELDHVEQSALTAAVWADYNIEAVVQPHIDVAQATIVPRLNRADFGGLWLFH